MDDSDSNSEEESDLEAEKLAKIVKVKEQNQEICHFTANECHHISDLQQLLDGYQTELSYFLPDSQYVIGNSDQVKVKYIVQVSQVKNA